MNRELFLSILTMDSYNRGYGQGIKGLEVSIGQTQIGQATIVRQSNTLLTSDDVAAGFYAIAYDVCGAGIVSAVGWRRMMMMGLGG